jgi:hypothetical protein
MQLARPGHRVQEEGAYPQGSVVGTERAGLLQTLLLQAVVGPAAVAAAAAVRAPQGYMQRVGAHHQEQQQGLRMEAP